MQTVTIEASRFEARRKYVEYRKAVRERKKAASEAERRIIKQDEALRRGYLELARGFKVIDLVASLRFAGCFANGLPKLAIMRADVRRSVFCRRSRGELQYLPHPDAWMKRGYGLKPQLKFDGSILTDPTIAQGTDVSGRAMLPSIPPSLRPPHSLSMYYILWEAVWEPLAPRDPMLLRPLGENLYAVVAVWDLTDLERAVLNARVER